MKKISTLTLLFLLLFIFSCNKNKTTLNESNFQDYGLSHYVDLKELQGQLHSIADNQSASVVSISTEKIISQPNNIDPFEILL